MSNNSVIEHRANYYYVMMQEDYLAICSEGKCSPHCKAMILSVLESWTNTKHGKGEGDFVYLTMPQWIKYTYMLYERNIITDCIKELLEEGLIARQSITMFFQKTFEYKLCTEKIQELIRALPVKGKEEAAPNLEAYLAFKDRGKVKRDAKKKLKEVGEKSRTGNNDIKEGEEVGEKSRTVREKSPEVGDNSPKVGEKSPQLIYTYNPLQPSNNQGYDVAFANRNDTPAFLSENKMGEQLPTPIEQLSPESVDKSVQTDNNPSVPLQASVQSPIVNTATQNAPAVVGDAPPSEQKPARPPRERKPKAAKEGEPTPEQINAVYLVFDELFRSVLKTPDPDFSCTQTKVATEAIKELIHCKATPVRLKAVFLDMWNDQNENTGEYWWRKRGRMSIKSVCNHYASRVISVENPQVHGKKSMIQQELEKEAEGFAMKSQSELMKMQPDKRKEYGRELNAFLAMKKEQEKQQAEAEQASSQKAG